MNTSFLLVVSDLLILGGLFLLGALIVFAILGKTDRLAWISLSLGLGAGVFSWSMFLLSWAGIPLNAGTVLGLYACLTLVAAILAWRTVRSKPVAGAAPASASSRTEVWLGRGFWVLIALLVLVVAFLSVGLSYFGWDDIANWVVKGYGIALQGSILAGREWGDNALSYPLNIPLLVAVFRLLDGNLLPGSKLLYPCFYAALLIGCYRFLIMHRINRWIASLGMLLLATTPIVFTHAYMGYTNLIFTFYLILGLIWCLEGMMRDSSRSALLGGLLLAIAVWTRPEGFVMAVAVFAALALAWLLGSRKTYRWLILLVPVGLVEGSWFIFSRTQPAASATAFGLFDLAWRGLLADRIYWSAFYTILRFIVGQVIRFRDWGLLPALMGILTLLGIRLSNFRRDPVYAALFFATLTIGLALIGLHYMAAYSPAGPGFVYDWLSLEFTRLAMPAGVSLTLLGLLSLQKTVDGRRVDAPKQA